MQWSRKLRTRVCSFIVLLGTCSPSLAQVDLDHRNVFRDGERVRYTIQYHLGFIWVSAGEVTFSVKKIRDEFDDFYQFTGEGRTYDRYDWIYRVRDLYRSTTLPDRNLTPVKFVRKVEEGRTFIDYEYEFDNRRHRAYSKRTYESGEVKLDTIEVQDRVYDVLSMIYVARCIDYRKYQMNDTIPVSLILDNEIHHTFIRYLGKERIEVFDDRYIDCIKIRPLLIEGTIFPGGEEMMVYVSDDEKKIPILIETPILVGTIKARINAYDNLVSPLELQDEE